MSWLRTDDGFTKHPKFEGWTPAQRWAWLEVMEYCARYETRGRIPTDLTLMSRSTTPRLLTAAEECGWCFRGEDGALWINDWDFYNPPRPADDDVGKRVAEAIEARPEASANEVFKMVGGRRREVLAAVKALRAGSHVGTEDGSGSGTGNHAGTGTRTPTRAAPARPVPSTFSETAASAPPADAIDLELLKLLDQIGVTGGLRIAACGDPDRAAAWAAKAKREATTNPGGYFRRGFESAEWPAEAPAAKAEPLSGFEIVHRQIANGAIDDPVTLGAEMRAHRLSEDEATELRSLIPTVEVAAA